MSLKVWFPFIKDTRNIGAFNYPGNSRAITFTSGKLGTAATFSSGCITFKTPLNTSTKNFTIAFWYKTSSPGNTQAIYNGRSTTGGPISIFCLGSHFRFDDGSQHSIEEYTIPSNQWHHYAFIRNEETIKLYVDSELVATHVSTAFTCNATYASIGASTTNNVSASSTTNKLIGQLNDYRIYDHCISEKELDNICNILIAHYPLNNIDKFTKNLIPNGDFKNGIADWPSIYSITESENGYYGGKCARIKHDSTEIVTPRKPLYVVMETGKKYTLSVKVKPISGSFDNKAVRCINSFTFGQVAKYELQNGWFQYIYQGVIDAQPNGNLFGFMDGQTGEFLIDDIKLELGETTLPIHIMASENKVCDISGYNNDLQIYGGSPSVRQDSPRYSTSLSGFTNNETYLFRDSFPIGVVNTVIFWAKLDSWQTGAHDIVFSEPNNNLIFAHSYTSGYLFITKNSGALKYPSDKFVLGQWNLVEIIRGSNESTSKLYINGEEILPDMAAGTSNWATSTYFCIGGRYSSNVHVPAWSGLISDFKIYGEPLTINEIIENLPLYNLTDIDGFF